MDESLPGPWNTYPRGKGVEAENGSRKKKEGDGRVACAVSKVEKERRGQPGSGGSAGSIGAQWRRASDCACTRHIRKVDPHNDLVTNCLDRKYYRREALAAERMPGPLRASCPFAALIRREK